MRALLALLLLAPLAAAADLTIKDLRLGTIVMGPQVKAEDLAGKVVLVEGWGLH